MKLKIISLTKQCSNEIALCEKEISALENEMQTKNDFKKRIEEMRRTLKRASEDANSGVINHSFVEKYIDKIYVTPIDETHMEMKIKLFTNETTTKYLENLRVRTGHTFKKMLPVRNKSYIRNNRNVEGHRQEVTYQVRVTY